MLEGLILRMDEKGKTGSLSGEADKLIKILSESYRLDEIRANDSLIVPFYNLRKFVMKGKYEARHFFLVERLNNLIDKTSSKDLQIEKVQESLNDVLNVLLSDIKPNVNTILFDDEIKKCVNLYMYLGSAKPGIMYFIKRMKKYFEQLKELPQDEGSINQAQVIKEIRDDSSLIVNEVLREEKNYSNFYRICYSYPCDYQKIITEQIGQKSDAINFNPVSGLPQGFGNLACHSFIFEEIIKEIIKNASHCYPDGYTLSILHAIENRMIVFSFVQDEPFKHTEHNGGLKNIVEKYVQLFDGHFEDNRVESELHPKKYIITIKLKIHEYSSGNDE